MQQNIELTAMNANQTRYVGVMRPCRLINAISAVHTTVTTNDTVITFSDGTTTIGTITIAAASAAGAVDSFVWAANVELNETTPLKMVVSGSPGAGATVVSLDFSEYHVAE